MVTTPTGSRHSSARPNPGSSLSDDDIHDVAVRIQRSTYTVTDGTIEFSLCQRAARDVLTFLHDRTAA